MGYRFSMGQISFTRFALFVFMVYVMNKIQFQLVLMERYSQNQDQFFKEKIEVTIWITNLQF